MTISRRVDRYLKSNCIKYDLLMHKYSEGSRNTSIAAHIPAEKLTKAVLLVDHDGKHLLVVIPATYKLNLKRLSRKLHRQFDFVPEMELSRYFSDCYPGAIPAVGQAYNIETIWDDRLRQQPDIYLEGGDHQVLIHMDMEEFLLMMGSQRHERLGIAETEEDLYAETLTH